MSARKTQTDTSTQGSMFESESDSMPVSSLSQKTELPESNNKLISDDPSIEAEKEASEALHSESHDIIQREATYSNEASSNQPNLENDPCLLPNGKIDLEKQKQKFHYICDTYITSEKHKSGMKKLLKWLAAKDFFSAPASTQFHGAYEGGLCQHSIDVWEYARKLNKSDLFPEKFNEESLCIAALFHDICKVGLYEKITKWRKDKHDRWESYDGYNIAEELHFGGHGSKSVYLLQWFLKLTNDEAVAINCHMGFADGSPTVIRDTSNAFHQFPMAWLIHVADEAATFLLKRDPSKQ